MRRFLAFALAAGLASQAAETRSLAEELAPVSLTVINGQLNCCQGIGPCTETSRYVDALAEIDGVCMEFIFSHPVDVELVFETSQPPGPFWLNVTPGDAWQRSVALYDWEEGSFDEILLNPLPAAGAALSGTVSGDYVDESSGTIVLRLTSQVGPGVGDENFVDEVEIVIPPPK